MQAKDPTTTRISRRAAEIRNCDTKTHSPSPVLKTDSCLSSASSRRKSASIPRIPAIRPILKYRLAPPTTTVNQPSAVETGRRLEDKARAERELRYRNPVDSGLNTPEDAITDQRDSQVEESSSAVSGVPPGRGAILLIVEIKAFSEPLGLF